MTFDHGMDVFTVPGSGTNCLAWPTGRANLLRNGQGRARVMGGVGDQGVIVGWTATTAQTLAGIAAAAPVGGPVGSTVLPPYR